MTQSPATPLPPPKERRRLREAARLTQGQLAARVGVTRETVRAWETGRTTPRGRKREVYAKVLASLADPAAVEKAAVEKAAEEKAVEVAQKAEPDTEVTARQPVVAVAAPLEAPAAEPVVQPRPLPGPEVGETLTPAQAFDALYGFCAPALVRQAYLLSGRRELARESVEWAFQLAWDRWPEVAVDPDPAGWVRAAAYEYALSPWHRFRPRYRHPEPPPADAADRALLDVLLQLPAPYRRTLVLHDGVGLRLPETAAETEATTPAAAYRLMHAREEVAARLPELSDPVELGRRLAELASAERLRAARPPVVRAGSERRARFWTRAAIAFTVAIIGATALTLRTAPTHYEPPVAPGETVPGVPPRAAPGPLSDEELELRAKLRRETANGPERLVPQVR
ncbi:helix-turn-helix domain-containing protein [Streptomyces sp. NPDC053367]|uniref:helix-turn-helix domain-containing protein n=1 Tax=Streptomyces sp. NPDC053367 TaxID=3365700 RepID=UPI0037D28901